MRSVALHSDRNTGLLESLQKPLLSAIIAPSGGDGRKRAHEAVAALENELFCGSWSEGDFLGTLPEFRARFGLGHKAQEEAIAILKNRGLVTVRRGTVGGLYVSHPSLREAAEWLLLHLSLRGLTYGCLIEARRLAHRLLCEAMLRAPLLQVLRLRALLPGSTWFAALADSAGNRAIGFILELIEEMYRRSLQLTGVEELEAACADETACLRLVDAVRQQQFSRVLDAVRELAGPERLQPTRRVLPPVPGLAGCASGRDWPVGALAVQLIAVIRDRGVDGGRLRLDSEAQIAEQFGAQVESVRPALRMLEDMGIVECQRGRRGASLRASPEGGPLYRLICASLAAGGVRAEDIVDATSLLGVNTNALATMRVGERGVPPLMALRGRMTSAALDLGSQMQVEHLLLDLAGNPIITAVTRAFALRYLFSDRCEVIGHFPIHVRARIAHCNQRILDAIAHGDVRASIEHTQSKDALMLGIQQ